ncbi:Rne/Rng family ribonuclease [Acetobacter sp. TBRC 12305]|uniref:Ribonuclease E n=1 Tax=Acetobacter garciniae TaxID=2817435 RepID=A0A939HMZ2_9PROT|nr:Rne/Rng family ribonuclease [Acetobacter garciniae]MBO1326642.1 Rne/Rng family ribonuclease [Acetobacter garciniae]MBX0346342.1 Rne/Rng family ribonuclease [Acetobacter garciniae]
MSKRMLIDATHAEETRVVVLDGNKLEDYDVESAAKKQLKGNIYLARVIRVEPSLQAAFVEYGGNRHGFLAFSEIHPDYYQIPVADREKLLALQAEEENLVDNGADDDEDDQIVAEATDGQDSAPAAAAPDETSALANGEEDAETAEPEPEYVSGETDTGEEALIQRRIARFLRNYRIQEVIRRRQILLVQVVKDERGNKGAALTTYISLAGRYCVLMPNALRGGGVSRKITAVSDRRRLRDIISSLNLPRGMAMIVRTAGAQRPGPEITRDCEYLLHLWDNIREHTMQSMAPALIYEEASLVKRAIRDVYTRDVSEILVDGESGWKAARDFMRMLMPQHAEKVRLWNKDQQPLFTHYHVEGHLDAMFSPVVHLRSGGYLVINQTEALVAIDVNSGKATGQRNIEETAFRTNQEAADEVARQLRLRDLAGLVVIDFIDMESRRHNVTIERRLKDALRNDRARIQIGSISHFGLLEMSRQRLRPSVAEATFVPCPHCSGTGMTRSVESSSLHVLRAVEEEGARRRASAITVHVASDIAFYILNHKRDWLEQIEQRHQMEVLFAPDATLLPPEIRIERRQHARPAPTHAQLPPVENVEADEAEVQAPEQAEVQGVEPANAEATAAPNAVAGEEEPRRRRRRRRRRRGENGNGQAPSTQQAAEDAEDDAAEDDAAPVAEAEVPEAARNGTADEGNLVQGRRRTRHTRVRRNERTPEAERPERAAPARETTRDVEVEIAAGPAPQRAKPVWNGPTPANPFGDEPDIFELLENSVAQRATAPAARPTPAVKASAPETVTAPQKTAESVQASPAETKAEAEPAKAEPQAEAESTPKPRRRTRRKPASESVEAPVAEAGKAEAKAEPAKAEPAVEPAKAATAEAEAAPAKAPRARRAPARKGAKAKAVAEAPAEAAEDAAAKTPAAAEKTAEDKAASAKPVRKRAPRASAAKKAQAEQAAEPTTDGSDPSADGDKGEPVVQPIVIEDSPPRANRRTGWWRR